MTLKKLFKTKQNKLTEKAVKELRKRGNDNIKADIKKFSAPQKVIKASTGEGFYPDITAVKGDKLRLFAVEGKETFNKKLVKEKWPLFSEFAKQNNSLFFIVFPKVLAGDVKKAMSTMEVQAQLWEIE